MVKRKPRRKTRPRRLSKRRRAKLFWTGRSQAVRLPKEFRFTGEAVLIWREGNRVFLESEDWPEGWLESFSGFTDWERPPQGEYEKRVEMK
jgi:antitoxin VapB